MKIQYHIFTLLVLFYSCRQTRNAYSIKTANGYYYSFLSTDTTVTEALKNNISPISIKNQFPGMILFENQIIVKQENDIFEPEHRQIELFSFPEQYNWYKKIHIDYQGNEKIKDNDQVKGTNIFDLSKVGNFYEIKGFFFYI